jgi:hypothetical protein
MVDSSPDVDRGSMATPSGGFYADGDPPEAAALVTADRGSPAF